MRLLQPTHATSALPYSTTSNKRIISLVDFNTPCQCSLRAERPSYQSQYLRSLSTLAGEHPTCRLNARRQPLLDGRLNVWHLA
jgi:hypothetical protein